MKSLALALALLSGAATAAIAQDAIPDLKGTWSGKGRPLVFGSNPHHPGSQTADAPPRVRDIDVSYVVDGQEGRLAWGRSSAPIATAISASPCSPLTAWTSATSTTARARAAQSSPPATRCGR